MRRRGLPPGWPKRNEKASEVCFFCGEDVAQVDPDLVFVALISPDDPRNQSMWGGHGECVAKAVHPNVFFVNPVTGEDRGPGSA